MSTRRLMQAMTLAAVGLAALMATGGSAGASHGTLGHWSGTGVRTVVVEGRGLDTAEAAQVWSQTPNLKLTAARGSGDCSPVPGRIVVCIGDPFGMGTPAAQPDRDLAGHIYQCVAAVPEQFLSEQGLAGIVNHEVGHCIGLHHREQTSNSVMAQTAYRYPDQHDNEELARLYGHDDQGLVCLPLVIVNPCL